MDGGMRGERKQGCVDHWTQVSGRGREGKKEEKKGNFSESCWGPSTFTHVIFTAIRVS